jgi:hypothetical protein
MIRLTDLAGNGSFTMGGKKFEYGFYGTKSVGFYYQTRN